MKNQSVILCFASSDFNILGFLNGDIQAKIVTGVPSLTANCPAMQIFNGAARHSLWRHTLHGSVGTTTLPCPSITKTRSSDPPFILPLQRHVNIAPRRIKMK
jgi:hypothetical protein